MAVASTYSNHIVLVGLGHLGFRVVLNLHEMDQELVVIERTPDHDLKSAVQELEIPVIEGDGRQESVLESAGVVHARAILLCTQNDSLNLQMAVKARGMNDQIRVITRIFDDDFAQALQKQFGFHALSATGMAAPAFASAAAGVDITRPLTVEGEALSLARFNLEQANGLVGLTVSSVEARFDVSVVLLRRDGHSDFHPSGLEDLRSGDVIAVLGGPNQLSGLVHGFNLKPA
jgi:Trk K+ transport system NAD-binding subunit